MHFLPDFHISFIWEGQEAPDRDQGRAGLEGLRQGGGTGPGYHVSAHETGELDMDAVWCLIAAVEIAIVIAAVVYTVWSQRRYRRRPPYNSSRR